MLKYDFYRGWMVDTSHRMVQLGAIANIVHRDLDLYFQGHKISGNMQIYNLENDEI